MINIYSIILNDKIIYVGQTKKDIDIRFKQHKSNASNNLTRKKCPKLYNKLYNYNDSEFSVKLIESVEDNFADERECFWIKHYDTIKNGCNICEGGKVNRGFNKTKEQRSQQSIIAKNNFNKSGLYSWNGSLEQKILLKNKFKNRKVTWGNKISKIKNDGPYKLILGETEYVYYDIGINKIAKIHNLNSSSLKLSLKNNSTVKSKGFIAKVVKINDNKSFF